jgi:hypothetical protein
MSRLVSAGMRETSVASSHAVLTWGDCEQGLDGGGGCHCRGCVCVCVCLGATHQHCAALRAANHELLAEAPEVDVGVHADVVGRDDWVLAGHRDRRHTDVRQRETARLKRVEIEEALHVSEGDGGGRKQYDIHSIQKY